MAEETDGIVPQSPIPISDNGRTDDRRDLAGPRGGGFGSGDDFIDDMFSGRPELFMHGGASIPSYWSRHRERFLDSLYKAVPEIKLAIHSGVRHLGSIIPSIEALNVDQQSDLIAAHLQSLILGEYWNEVKKALRDFMVHDTGAYIEILSGIDPSQEELVTRRDGIKLVGALQPFEVPGFRGVFLSAAGLRTLPPERCIPTSDPEYPVLYQDKSGKRFALHDSRVLRMVNLPSSDPGLNGIGLGYLSVAVETANQVHHAQRLQSAVLEGNPVKSIIFCAPWDGNIIQRQIRDIYAFRSHANPGEATQTPIAIAGVTESMHTLSDRMITNFSVEQLALERLPEGYDRDKWSEDLLRKFAAIMGMPVKLLGIDMRFSSRQDSESQSDLLHNVGASDFIAFLEHQLSNKFCTLNTCMRTSYNDEILEKRMQESRHLRAQTYEIELSAGVTDLESVLRERVGLGDITESEAERILANRPVSTDGPPEQKGEAPGDFIGDDGIIDYNAKLGVVALLEPLQDDDDDVDSEKTEASYARSLRAVIRGVWTGDFEPEDAKDQLFLLVGQNMRESALKAARRYGVEPGELTEAENRAINDMIDVHADSIESIVDQAFDGSKAAGGLLRPLFARLQFWYPRYSEIADRITAMVAADQKLRWQRNPVKDSCNDCIVLDGRVARGSRWDELGIYPKSRSLECGGYKCGCSYVATRDAVTRGRWPNLGRRRPRRRRV